MARSWKPARQLYFRTHKFQDFWWTIQHKRKVQWTRRINNGLPEANKIWKGNPPYFEKNKILPILLHLSSSWPAKKSWTFRLMWWIIILRFCNQEKYIKNLHLFYSAFLFIIFEPSLRHYYLRRNVKVTVTLRKGLSEVDFGAKPSLKPISTYKSQRQARDHQAPKVKGS